MSVRRTPIKSVAVTQQSIVGPLSADRSDADLDYDSLTPNQRQAASLGVSPDAWKPISFMNDAHHDALLKANALSGPLAQKLAAFAHVAGGGE